MLKVSKEILDNNDIEFRENTDLTNFSTIKLKAQSNLFIVKTIEGLKVLTKYLLDNNYEYTLLGLGANQVLNNKSTYIKLKLDKSNNLDTYQKEYYLSASVNLNQMSSCARKFNLDGWQVITGIPATLGGAIAMNAGTRVGEIKDIVKSIDILRSNNEVETIINNPNLFKYRGNNFLNAGDIIIGATLVHNGQKEGVKEEITEYLNKRKIDQPWGTANCGCVFKNSKDISAGKAIDLLGLKGYEYKGLKISTVHANYIENTNGSYEDFKELVEFINSKLESFFGYKFELEVKID
jgi:UDP-N-acetylmuramate dehydrogenase